MRPKKLFCAQYKGKNLNCHVSDPTFYSDFQNASQIAFLCGDYGSLISFGVSKPPHMKITDRITRRWPLYGLLLALAIGLASAISPAVGGSGISPEALGERLFSDPILSLDRSISCASCHIPEFAFADTVAFSIGIGGQRGTRNTPSSMNMLARDAFFWDGRAATLEEQALMPIENPVEMGLPIAEAIARLRSDAEYVRWFREAFGGPPDAEKLAAALAAFQRTLETADTPWDRFAFDIEDIDPAVVRGKAIFDQKGKCLECHFTPDFTADEFRNIGLYNGSDLADEGRFAISRDSADLGKFKVPGLRNVAITAPYMHNGMFATLREVIDYYDDPKAFVPDVINVDTLLREPLGLTEQEKVDLEAFLHSLTDRRFVK
jgi:cytochrome c peroxidase